MKNFRFTSVFALACGLGFAATNACAETWTLQRWYAFDVDATSSVGLVRDHEFMASGWRLPRTVRSIGLPAQAEIAALARDGTDVLWSPSGVVEVGGLVVTPQDVARTTSGGVTTIAFAGSVMGLPKNVGIDAIALDGANLLFSADAWASIGSTVAAPADVLRWNGASVSTAWAASAMSIPPGADLIALERLGNGHLVVGFDVAVSIGGTVIAAGDLAEYSPSAGVWERHRSSAQLGVSCSPCRVTAVASEWSGDDVIFQYGAEDNE